MRHAAGARRVLAEPTCCVTQPRAVTRIAPAADDGNPLTGSVRRCYVYGVTV
jgi:hypothetical protein